MRRQPRQARSQERVNRILDVAEELFIEEGYNATTTNAIAKRAKVAIGSLYQFFPDKTSILQGLALRYNELLYQRLSELNTEALVTLPLTVYVDQMIDATDQFFTDYPGYYAIFMPLQGTIPELQEIEAAADAHLIQNMATELSLRNAGLESPDYEAIAFVLVKAIGNLLWLALGQEKPFRQRLVTETKRLTLHYLQSYFSSEFIPAHQAEAGVLPPLPHHPL
ncbi:MAG: TetR family transcriptional regulator [Oscillatoriophycideae cyanobacterium NC_groundwater_1537_Pr4_S-0.65um_50_18]|nr:TetR family transcriptional regulator [Oscillatoriophycideae cyanobacterium NC_groundwater_1537_Pr4_S-0.65um_50_18]